MFWLIESEEQLSYFKNNPIDEAFVEVIPFHDNIHPCINNVSLIYIRPFNDTKGYMLCIDHSETFSINKTTITNILTNIGIIWVQDKKSFLYYFQLKNINDLSILNNSFNINHIQVYTQLYNNNPNYEKINRLIPVSKHYEKLPKPVLIAIQEFAEGKIYSRNPAKETN